MGLAVGAVSRSHVRTTRRDAGRTCTDSVRRARSARAVQGRRRCDRLRAHARGAGNRHDDAATADEHRQQLHRRVRHLRRHEPETRVASRRPGRRDAVRQQGDAPDAGELLASDERSRRCRRGAGDGSDGRARRQSNRRGRRGRCPRKRERCADGGANVVRARAQPHRLDPAAAAVGGDEVRDRPARGRRRGAVRDVSRISPGARRAASRIPRLQPERQRIDLERVRDGRLPSATA